jgi:hypothetical protein
VASFSLFSFAASFSFLIISFVGCHLARCQIDLGLIGMGFGFTVSTLPSEGLIEFVFSSSFLFTAVASFSYRVSSLLVGVFIHICLFFVVGSVGMNNCPRSLFPFIHSFIHSFCLLPCLYFELTLPFLPFLFLFASLTLAAATGHDWDVLGIMLGEGEVCRFDILVAVGGEMDLTNDEQLEL